MCGSSTDGYKLTHAGANVTFTYGSADDSSKKTEHTKRAGAVHLPLIFNQLHNTDNIL